LDSASLTVPQGMLVAVTGPRRSGKATLLGVLSNNLLPDPSDGSENNVFVPPHLRVLNVTCDPLTIAELNLWQNLCFGPSDGADEAAPRVLAICRRLEISKDVLTLVEKQSETDADGALGHHFTKAYMPDTNAAPDKSKPAPGPPAIGSPESCAKRQQTELHVSEGAVLAHTDRCLLHFARALVMNPEVMIIHKPLSHFDSKHARLVLEILREFVDDRGIEKPREGKALRRPRTCIFSEAESGETEVEIADLVLNVSDGKVREVNLVLVNQLQARTRQLISKWDRQGDHKVAQEDFIKFSQDEQWLMEALRIYATDPGVRKAEVLGIWQSVANGDEDKVSIDVLMKGLRSQFAKGVDPSGKPEGRQAAAPMLTNGKATVWDVPDVPLEVPSNITPGMSGLGRKAEVDWKAKFGEPPASGDGCCV